MVELSGLAKVYSCGEVLARRALNRIIRPPIVRAQSSVTSNWGLEILWQRAKTSSNPIYEGVSGAAQKEFANRLKVCAEPTSMLIDRDPHFTAAALGALSAQEFAELCGKFKLEDSAAVLVEIRWEVKTTPETAILVEGSVDRDSATATLTARAIFENKEGFPIRLLLPFILRLIEKGDRVNLYRDDGSIARRASNFCSHIKETLLIVGRFLEQNKDARSCLDSLLVWGKTSKELPVDHTPESHGSTKDAKSVN
ncbi:MAG: hypothetical protein WC901_02440 [Candidatus Margulisiibacteriota bacterium]